MATGDHVRSTRPTDDTLFPDARYVLLASRLVPGLDGGFTIATMNRARHMADAGVEGGRGPMLLTVDPGSPKEHADHRAEFIRTGAVGSRELFRNLFDELRADPSWLYAVAEPGGVFDAEDSLGVFAADGRRVATIPVVEGPEWYLTDAHVVVHGPQGDRFVQGFRGLYRAWLDHVVAELTGKRPGPDVVVICESRQLGVLLVGWTNPRARLVHTIHTCHLLDPYTPDAPLGPMWDRWFAHMEGFDAVLWPTRQQQQDVEQRFGAPTIFAVVPNAAPPVPQDLPTRPEAHAVVVTRLVSVKRLDHIIRAWEKVVAAVPHATLDIYGEGPLRPELERAIAAHGLGEHVALRGLTAYDPRLFDGAALTMQTSAYEGQGLAPLEAMSRGCPVVTYDVRYGPRDRAVIGGEVLIEDGDLDALADAVIRLLVDRAWQQTLSRGAIACARAFSAEHAMAAMAEAIATALAAPRRRRPRQVDAPIAAVDESSSTPSTGRRRA